MAHIDEHTLELYVLDPDGLGDALAGIKGHLKECPGCSRLTDQIRAFYLQAEETFGRELPAAPIHGQSLTLHRKESVDLFSTEGIVPSRLRLGDRGLIRNYARRHPVAFGTGAFGLVATALAAAFLLTRGPDGNPSYVHLNPGQEMLEAYDAANHLVWKLPAENLEGAQAQEEHFQVRFSQVTDLDGDGKNEVVTGVSLNLGSAHAAPALRILDSKSRLLVERQLGAPVRFGGMAYSGEYRPSAVLVAPSHADGKKEILVAANNTHSPSVITRLSAQGDILGEYWHFGMLTGMYLMQFAGKTSLVVCGTDDTEDTTGVWRRSKPVILVLDPAKITGRTECSFAPGFGFNPSSAELHYIVLPRTDIHEALKLPFTAINMFPDSDTTLAITAASRDDGPPIFAFVFNKDFKPLSVRSTTTTDSLHATLLAQGKLSSRWGAPYFDSLRQRVAILK